MPLLEYDISITGQLALRDGINWGLYDKFRGFFSWIISSLAYQKWI